MMRIDEPSKNSCSEGIATYRLATSNNFGLGQAKRENSDRLFHLRLKRTLEKSSLRK
jgi:hypothetical protein